MNPYLKSYAKLVEFLAEVLGQNSEIVLHDVTSGEPVVVDIRNGEISGRAIDTPASQHVRRILEFAKTSGVSYTSNSVTGTKNAQNIRSMSFFIRDEKENLVGLLCINTDNLQLISMRNYLNSLIGDTDKYQDDVMLEQLNISAEEQTMKCISNIIADNSIDPTSLSQDDKTLIIKTLYQSGVFVLKGAVNITARALEMSIPSVYRYMKLVKEEASAPEQAQQLK